MDKHQESLINFTFSWTIENYFTGFKKVGESIKSPTFSAAYLNVKNLYINLYPMGDSLITEKHVSCYLWGCHRDVLDVLKEDMDYKFEIIDSHKSVFYSQPFIFEKTKEFSGIRKTVPLSKIMDEMDYATFTVRLVITRKNAKQASKMECIARSKFISDRYNFSWEVKNNLTIQSRNFEFLNRNYEVVIDLTKNTFKIKTHNDTGLLQYMNGNFTVLDSEGINKATKVVSHVFTESNDTLQIPTFFPEDFYPTGKECSTSKSYTLMCNFSFPNGSLVSNVEYNEINPPPSIECCNVTLCDDFQKMYVDKIFTDVKFRIGDKMLFAHKNVLSVRSPVFLAMFSQSMIEKETDVVDIEDSDLDIFDVFLLYFYSGIVDNMYYELALKLMILADKYQVNSLLEKCAAFLASNISDENVLKIILTADAIQQRKLKNIAVVYIKVHAKDILKTNEWQQCLKNNTDVATEILSQLTSELNNYFQTLF